MDMNCNSKLEEYYQKFVELQEKLKRSEEQRFVLEMKFNEMVHVAEEEEQAHFRKLRSQYKKFLEEDRKRQERNERIIRNLERIETKITMLSAKTERINMFRRQYQSYLRRMIANRNGEMKTSESRISRERSFIKEEPFKKQQPKLFRDDYSIPEKPKETLEGGKPVYDHPTVLKAMEKDRSNEEKIEILDRYLQSISTQKCRDILDQERQAREDVSSNTPSNIYYTDDFSLNATNQAASVADDIMNSIYSRYYSKPDTLSNENKGLEIPTQRDDRNLNKDTGNKSEKNTPTVSFNPNTHVLNDNKNIGHKIKVEDEKPFNSDPAKSKSNESTSILNQNMHTNLLLNYNKDQSGSKRIIDNSLILKQEENNVDILNRTDSNERSINQFNLDSGQKTNPPFNFSSICAENMVKHEISNNIEVELTDKLIRDSVNDTLTIHESFEENKISSGIVCCKEDNQQDFIQEELRANGQRKEQPQEQFTKDDIKDQRDRIQSVKNKENNHDLVDQPYLDHTQNGNNQYDKHDEPQEQFRKDIIKNQPVQNQSVENKEEDQGLVDQPDPDHRQNGNNQYDQNNFQNKSNIDVQQTSPKEHDHSSIDVEYNQNNHQTDQHIKTDQPIGVDDNQLLLHDQNIAVIPSEPYPSLQQYDVNHGQSAQFGEMGPPLEYSENDPSYQQIQYDEHGQPIEYDQNIQPTGYDQYGEFLLYDENGQVVQPQYDKNGQILPQYDANGQLIMLYDQNGQPFFTDQYKSDQQQYDENGYPLLQYNENGQPVLQYDENGQPMYDQNQYYDYTNQGQTNVSNECGQVKSDDQDDTENEVVNGQVQNVNHENEIENAGISNQESYLDTDVGVLNDHLVNTSNKNQNDDVVLGDQEPYHDTEDGEANDNITVNALSQNKYSDIADPNKEKSQDSSSPEKKTDQYQPIKKDSHQVGTEKDPDVKTTNNDGNSKIDKGQLENEKEEGLKDNESNKPTNVMDILDTDTESVKQNTSKVSNDSDFDFS